MKIKQHKTPKRLFLFSRLVVSIFCKRFCIIGKENIKEKCQNQNYIIVSSHISNLDALAAIVALGDILDLQITIESTLFKPTEPQWYIFQLTGKENFSPLQYEKLAKRKEGKFNPKDFEKISQKMAEGKTPWIVIHPFTHEEKMQKAKIGPIYLAQKTGASIIPTALEYENASLSLAGRINRIKALIGRLKGNGIATYRIGEPVKLPKIENVEIIEKLYNKKMNGEKITEEEEQESLRVVEKLKTQADYIARIISEMLPPQNRGIYGE
ncbi:MAG: hypothetical protein PHD51_04090 [Patescibacteria group bacterium]|nr:hypothetical protein [Patescibacteria group bacterium]MDD5490806.1 hypothetical protein [Patescibacteria group bacterium]